MSRYARDLSGVMSQLARRYFEVVAGSWQCAWSGVRVCGIIDSGVS